MHRSLSKAMTPESMIAKRLCALAFGLLACLLALVVPSTVRAGDSDDVPTTTPIKHIVVIFQENISFDHYFGTYPHAVANADGSVYFFPGRDTDTPRANTLESAGLLTDNPNGANPVRIDRSFAVTCDNDHDYQAEQAAFDGGLMDMFVAQTGCTDKNLGKTVVLDYFDGNTVTAMWNYAQHFSMSDNFFATTFGPSTPGAVNVVAGNTFEATVEVGSPAGVIAGGSASSGSDAGDADPFADVCSSKTESIRMTSGQNIGDLLNARGITWGGFMGGFNLSLVNAANGSTGCSRFSTGLAGNKADYVPHHAWFQYWESTANPTHARPSSPSMIGKTDAANHEYDVNDFFTALSNGHLPAVSYLKAIGIQDGHAGYSDPLDEQTFLVNTINAIEKSPEWGETAIFITYDDSDGWYDHVMGPIVNQSNVLDPITANSDGDALLGPGNCGKAKPDADGVIENGRCGYGPRLPLMVISPFAKQNYIDHRVTDFSSIVRFIEDNFGLGRLGGGSNDAIAGTLDGLFDFDDGPSNSKLILDSTTGEKK